MIYPDYMTQEDIAEFEMDMARFELDPSMEYDEINGILREIYLDELAAQSEMLQFYNI
jgi:lipoprotein NlpI